uniref:Uncharacterized protein n=1 Tax=Anguilla anguilla TaxID=7936 RepID=A0A0E9QFD3_ANGAN
MLQPRSEKPRHPNRSYANSQLPSRVLFKAAKMSVSTTLEKKKYIEYVLA